MRKLLALSIIGFLLIPQESRSWNGRGHMIVAAIAWHSLSMENQQVITDILIEHPDYERWKIKYEDYSDDIELGLFLMMQASKWPDDIRSGSHELNRFHRPQWHYITYELRYTGSHSSDLPEDKTPYDNSVDHIVEAIDHTMENVQDMHNPPTQRAMYLAWVIHLIGDVHQPLHTASRFDADDLKRGDLGGNKIYIKPDEQAVKLHSFWDGLLGKSTNSRWANNQALTIQKDNPRTLSADNDNLVAWSLESFDLADKKAHLEGKLVVATSKSDAKNPGKDYGSNAKSVAESQVALAGYRLAEAISQML